MKVKSLSRVQLLATPWTTAHQAPPSIGFSRQEYWSGVPLPSVILHEAYPKTSVMGTVAQLLQLRKLWQRLNFVLKDTYEDEGNVA